MNKDLIITKISHETFVIINTILSPAPRDYKNCSSNVIYGNEKTIIVKNGKKKNIIYFE